MRMGWLRGAALVLSVLLGIGGGVAASVLVENPDGATRDPLVLGAQLVNLDCTGSNIIVVGRGDHRPGLRAAVVENPGQARYLETAHSCPTLYAPTDVAVPEYVVYLGPYDTPGQACEIRMSVEHKGDYVTRLRDGNQIYAKCPCELSTSTMPVLTPGVVPDELAGMWTRQLQGMLEDIGRLTEEQVTGAYDPTTVATIERIQDYEGIPADGVVDERTWEVVVKRACRNYDY